MGFFDSFFQTPDPQAAAAAQTQGYQTGYKDLVPQLQQGRNAVTTNYTAGLQPFVGNVATANKGTNTLADALGLNGPEGNARALAAFNNNPATQNMIDLASENVKRNQASTGQLASGATNIDLAKVAPEIFQGAWQNYMANLQPFLPYSTQSAGGVAQGYQGLGSQLNQSFGTQGAAAYGTDVGVGNAKAGAANATGPGWGLLSGILNNASKAYGASGGGGGGGFFGGFGGGGGTPAPAAATSLSQFGPYAQGPVYNPGG